VPLSVYYAEEDVTVPAGTAIATPQTTVVNLGDIWCYAISVRIPAGHCGFTGLAVIQAGSYLLPFGQTLKYLIGNDDKLDFDIGVEIPGNFTLQTYNTDVLAHTFYVRIAYQPMVTVNNPQPVIIPI
jgi:hypothetical protein